MSLITIEIGMAVQALFTFSAHPAGIQCVRVLAYRWLMQIAALAVLIQMSIRFIVISTSSITMVIKLKQQRHLMVSMGKTSGNKSKDAQIGTMLVAISVLYLFTNTPVLCVLLSDHISHWSQLSLYHLSVFYALQLSAMFLKAINHTINFYIYCLTAAAFRNEVKAVFKETCRRG